MKSDQDIFDYLDALLWAVAHGFLQFAPDGSAKCSSYCLTNDGCAANLRRPQENEDRKSTRLNSSHLVISYAVFCLKKKTTLLLQPQITWIGEITFESTLAVTPLSSHACTANPGSPHPYDASPSDS